MRVKNCVVWALMLGPVFGKPVPVPMPPVDSNNGNNVQGGGGGGSSGFTSQMGLALGAAVVGTALTCVNYIRATRAITVSTPSPLRTPVLHAYPLPFCPSPSNFLF